MGILPLTAGLLISMAIRHDHGFGLAPQFFPGTVSKETLATKQIKLIRKMRLAYDQLAEEVNDVDDPPALADVQLWEEVVGKGYYRAALDSQYLDYATPEGRREAIDLASQVVSFRGPLPIFDMEEGDLDDDDDRSPGGLCNQG